MYNANPRLRKGKTKGCMAYTSVENQEGVRHDTTPITRRAKNDFSKQYKSVNHQREEGSFLYILYRAPNLSPVLDAGA